MEERVAEGRKVKVIGCGNILMGNDSAGLRVIEILEESNPSFELIDGGTGGLGLLPLMEGADLVIIVDAMIGIGEKPGDIRIFNKTPPYRPSKMSFQDVGVAEVIDIAGELLPDVEVVAIGIEAGEIKEYSDKVDPEVMEGVQKAALQIIDLVAGSSQA
ncbi:MAG: hydrogenase maturation protease [Methanomicrobiaceae archaeon]|nr:hydrogenase maturation protease [Methanomicrobiaceae archaeon]